MTDAHDDDTSEAEVPETPEPLEAIEVDQTLHPVDPNVVLPDPNAPEAETTDDDKARRRDRSDDE